MRRCHRRTESYHVCRRMAAQRPDRCHHSQRQKAPGAGQRRIAESIGHVRLSCGEHTAHVCHPATYPVWGLYYLTMIKMFSPQASRSLDAECIAAGMTEGDLITIASSCAASIITQIIASKFPDRSTLKIIVACGPGNNGADGLMIASELSLRHRVIVLCPPPDLHVSPGNAYARSRLSSAVSLYGYDHQSDLEMDGIDVIIDALLGSGSRLPLNDTISALAARLHVSSALKIAIDIPTGLDALTGSVDPNVMRCNHTIAMEGYKPGHIRASGPDVCGQIHVAAIGAPAKLSEAHSDGSILEESDIGQMLPRRHRRSSKFDFGHVLVIGGTLGMRGAPSMSAHAALAIGAGLVDLATPSVHPLTPREIMTTSLAHHDDGTIASESVDVIMQRMQRAGVIALGPGMGSNPRTIAIMAQIIETMTPEQTLVLDADGLRCLPLLRHRACELIITPHLGELARLLELDRDVITANYAEYAAQVAQQHGCVVHAKQVPAATVYRDHTTYLTRGNPAMATAGAGDVLTGIIAGLRAQGMTIYDATRVGAWIHAVAGDEQIARTGSATMMATDLIGAAARIRGNLTADLT
ncbi:MAG: NAD(P)H-hydrate dehydratase [Candidatus Kapabacteria bacterium]|nr:NAD(P)H-hydrate dehydratase [Candidatus Kapabacteria bacterium]